MTEISMSHAMRDEIDNLRTEHARAVNIALGLYAAHDSVTTGQQKRRAAIFLPLAKKLADENPRAYTQLCREFQ